MRGAAAAVLVLLLGGAAPFQCASDPDPNRRLEDSAPESLWELSERFEERGEHEAREQTLRYIIERYPSSRFAQRAELALRGEDTGEDVERPHDEEEH